MSAAGIVDDAVAAAVKEWLAMDQDPCTKQQVTDMIEAGDTEQLNSCFGSRIAFGTAGLRAAMKAGPSMMNQLVVTQTSQGLCKYLEATCGGTEFAVVVGYDGRHNSKAFATRTAAAFLSRGVTVHMFEDICPTPYVAYAVTHFSAAAGIMVTASHNPKEDNGYKVYWSNGAQIVSPHDKNIASAILANLEPWEHVWNDDFVAQHANLKKCMNEVSQSYMKDLLLLPYNGKKPSPQCKITYTAMHGVGYKFCMKAYETAGFEPLIAVKEQVDPDPDFPTVTYPNPEEGKGALALAMKTADSNGSTVILANDPDADRLAVAVKHDNAWRILNGNEIGALLGHWTWLAYKKTGGAPERAYMLSSTVSSMILKSMASCEGFKFEDTLTGFKWMGNRARELQKEGFTNLLSFEEAIGFAVGDRVVDKDGVSASVVMGGLVNHLSAEGKTLVDQLNIIYDQYGYHASYGSYFICRSKPTIETIFKAIREGGYPTELAGESVIRVRDLTTGYDDGTSDRKATLPTQSSNMITFWLASKILITLRTSGTEPKIKFYSEIIADASKNKKVVEDSLRETVDRVVDILLQPTKYNLGRKKE